MIQRQLYIDRVKPFIGKNLIKVLTGQRRVGKSVLLKLIMNFISETNPEANIIYIDKEDYKFDQLNDYKDLINYISENEISGENYVFIDEIQDIYNFEKALRSLYNKNNFDIYCTGSNASVFTGELSTVLSGRQMIFHIGSLDFNEFCLFHKLNSTQETLMKYMMFGGLPYLIHLPDNENTRFEYLKNITSTILYRDVINRNKIRDPRFLDDLIKFLSENIGSQFSANKISKYLKSQNIKKSVSLILDYLSYIEDAYFINQVKRMDVQGKKTFEIGEKYYFEDIGLRNSIVGFNISDIGKIIENLVYLHLRNNGYDIKIGYSNDKEIDFVAMKKHEVSYFQVCYLLNDSSTIDREFGNLLLIKDNYPKYVISFNSFTTPNTYKGIKHLTLLEFLTEYK